MKTYILYHGNCYDGFGAAFAAWLTFGYRATYLPCHYGKPVPEIDPGSRVFILDFSYPREQLLALKERVADLVVIDHHKTAQAELEGLPFATFDLTRSGAVLAWKYFRGPEPIPNLLRYIEDRDLWKFELPKSREVSAALRLYTFDFDLWKNLGNRLAELMAEGEICLQMTKQQVNAMCDQAVMREICGYDVPVVNATVAMSEVGEELLKRYPADPFAAYYFDRADGFRQWGLRSRPDFDCSVVAKLLGGGGHPQACGFQTPYGDLHEDCALNP